MAAWTTKAQRVRGVAVGTSLCATAALSACDNLLDVENVTFIEAADVRNAASAELWANGVYNGVAGGWDGALLLLSAASDELRFAGQFAYWGELDSGHLNSPNNQGLNELYGLFATSQWYSGEAIHVLDSLYQDGSLADVTPLARVYLYGAIIHTTVADVMEDYAPSAPNEPGPALGSANMGTFYDLAVQYATSGLALQPGGALERDLLAARARAGHAKLVWQRIRPTPANTSGGGLVSGGGAMTDARAALGADGSDWRFEFDYPQGITGSNTAGTINCLSSLRFGNRYVTPTPDDLRAASVLLRDPIDDVPDPSLHHLMFEVIHIPAPCPFKTFTVMSAREMHLIVAEDALANADTATFAIHVNAARAAEGLTPWTAGSGIAAWDMLVYERQTRLFLTGRRLADMYRFGIQSDSWEPSSAAASTPGTLYPIPAREIEANCRLNGSCG
jgi:starch-binding outer membrane protein, SusD/RagB family